MPLPLASVNNLAHLIRTAPLILGACLLGKTPYRQSGRQNHGTVVQGNSIQSENDSETMQAMAEMQIIRKRFNALDLTPESPAPKRLPQMKFNAL